MGKLVKAVLALSLRNRVFVFFMTGLLVVVGFWCYTQTPIEAFPDVTNTQIVIITQWNGRSAQEVERFVTVPLEVAMSPVQRKTSVRSITMFGLSVIKIIFEDDVEDPFARQQVNNQLVGISLPDGVAPDVQPPYGPTGEIFRYTLEGRRHSSRDLLTLQNWVVDRELRSVPGVADINAFGGADRTFEVSVNPQLLEKYGLTPLQVYDAVSKSNVNVGGDVIEKNGQAYVVRGVGLLSSAQDIGNLIVDQRGGVPVLVRNVASVAESNFPRVGQAGRNRDDDVVEGIVVMRKGANPSEVLAALKARIAHVNREVLPEGVKIVPFYDRDELMAYCTHTVLHNLFEGILLVTVIVMLFMADWRTTVIVSSVIPLSLLFAFVCMRLKGMSANLLSMGAVDFGIIIDGAVVMVEGLFVALDYQAVRLGMPAFNRLSKLGLIKSTGAEMGKSVFFSKLIIVTALLPIFAFQKVEGKMFSPLAYTLGFALVGALACTLTLVPVLVSVLMKKNVRERHNPLVVWIRQGVMSAFDWTQRHKAVSLSLAMLLLVGSFASSAMLGTEFLPPLNEGALWVEAKMPMSSSLPEAVKMVARIRAKLLTFPEVKEVLSQTGRPNDGTDPSGFYYMQSQVNLWPKEQWRRKISMDSLVNEMDAELKQYQGIEFNYSQPIIDNVQEAVAGMNANNAVKIFGPDLDKLDTIADRVKAAMENVRGLHDLGVVRNLGQPEISIHLDREKMAASGVLTSDCQAVIEMAIGGKTATELYEGERKFDVRIRYQYEFRKSEDEIRRLMVPTIRGRAVPLAQVADITTLTGPAFIYRDANRRFIGVKFTVRDRDLGSTVREAQEKVAASGALPPGYTTEWTGEFENQVRASHRLFQMVPICLVLIFTWLFITFGNPKDAGLVLLNVPFALVGGILALHATHTIFGISAGVGFIALFGVCVQNGVILISVFKKNLKLGLHLAEAVRMGVASRVRPVVMTALMAAIGLLPAALSTGIGSETQKPLAIVVIGGLISATALTLLIFPLIFQAAYRKAAAK